MTLIGSSHPEKSVSKKRALQNDERDEDLEDNSIPLSSQGHFKNLKLQNEIITPPLTPPSSFFDYEHFWTVVLGSPKHVLAPMVDQSELVWRLLARKHGAHLCFTPMLNSKIYLLNPTYRQHNLLLDSSTDIDRPLIAQICGDNAETLVKVGMMLQDKCDAVDLNLGCPQGIAKKGHYGAFLMDDLGLIEHLVTSMSKALSVPVTCKIRIFPEVQKTIEYARMLVRAGARALTVHGRTREQKGTETGLADWSQIRAVVKAISPIPVIANGNILDYTDVDKCLTETGARAVMSAEPHLYNPCIFEQEESSRQSGPKSKIPLIWEMVEEYIELVKQYPGTPVSYVRGHLFKLYRPCLALSDNIETIKEVITCKDDNPTLIAGRRYSPYRQALGLAKSNDELFKLCFELNELLMDDYKSYRNEIKNVTFECWWKCVPYVRHKKKADENKVNKEDF